VPRRGRRCGIEAIWREKGESTTRIDGLARKDFGDYTAWRSQGWGRGKASTSRAWSPRVGVSCSSSATAEPHDSAAARSHDSATAAPSPSPSAHSHPLLLVPGCFPSIPRFPRLDVFLCLGWTSSFAPDSGDEQAAAPSAPSTGRLPLLRALVTSELLLLPP
jgi:hypothetical protein